jgi:serine/threonine protein kinase
MLKRRGTPGYIAPELLLGGEVAVTEKADVYRWEKWDFSVPIVRC